MPLISRSFSRSFRYGRSILTIVPPSDTDFSANPIYGLAPLTVNFTDLTEGNPFQWEWDFTSDGTVDSTIQNPTYTYYNPGLYSVSLKTIGNSGTSSKTRTSYISVGVPLTINWATTQSGIIEIPQSGGWEITNDGRTIRFNVQDSANCGGLNNQIQSGIATASISTGDFSYNLNVVLDGIGEVEAIGYENMDLYLDNVKITTATSPGGSRECDPNESVVQTVIVPGPYFLESNTTHEFRLEFSTTDHLYHLDSYYVCNLIFVPILS